MDPNLIPLLGVIIPAAVAGWGVWSASRSFKRSQAPYIGLHLTAMDFTFDIQHRLMILNIENFGQQTACNVKLNFSKDFNPNLFLSPDSMGGINRYTFIKTSAYRSSISSIAPGQSLKFAIVDLKEVKDAIQNNGDFASLRIRYSWESERGKKYNSSIVINFEDYLSIINPSSDVSEIAQELKQIRDILRPKTLVKAYSEEARINTNRQIKQFNQRSEKNR